MIYGKLWCVVRPSVGIPIIIGAVAVASFSVHLALTINTTWVKGFLNSFMPFLWFGVERSRTIFFADAHAPAFNLA